MKILLTGATGFIGSSVLEALMIAKHKPVVVARNNNNLPAVLEKIIVDDIDSNTDFGVKLSVCSVVIHCAARVHVMNEGASDPSAEFRKVNTFGTLNLARQAVDAGVKRFIFVSSIKVLGEGTASNSTYYNSDRPNPADPYAASKFEAEQGLKEIATKSGIEVVIIRPSLVYGPGVKANFLNMMKWIHQGIPLPFGAIHNKRSLVSLDNLVDLILTCIEHPRAANEIFLVSDDRDVSTTELLNLLAVSLGKHPLLLPIPMSLINFAAMLFGRPDLSRRLCGSLQVDIQHTKDTLDWKPPYTIEDSLLKTANAFKQALK